MNNGCYAGCGPKRRDCPARPLHYQRTNFRDLHSHPAHSPNNPSYLHLMTGHQAATQIIRLLRESGITDLAEVRETAGEVAVMWRDGLNRRRIVVDAGA